jgi:hypothetical protein
MLGVRQRDDRVDAFVMRVVMSELERTGAGPRNRRELEQAKPIRVS